MPEIHYPFARTLPEYGVPMEVVPGIKWLRMPLPFALDHVNLWMIADNDGWCQVDTGLTWEPIKDIWRNLFQTHTLTRQMVTHYHPDHAGLAGWLHQEKNLELWMTQGEYLTAQAVAEGSGSYNVDSMVELFRHHGLDRRRLDALKHRGNGYRVGVPLIPPVFRRLLDDQTIRIGEYEWQVIVGYGHAVEHAAFYCEALKVLIAGDMLLPSISTNIPVTAPNQRDNPLKLYLESLQRYRSLPEDTLVLPCHGRPFIGAHTRVDFLKAHHRNRCDSILEAVRQPRTACELLPILFDWGELDTHQLMFAMGESIAHLNYLEAQGQITRIEDQGAGIVRFKIA